LSGKRVLATLVLFRLGRVKEILRRDTLARYGSASTHLLRDLRIIHLGSGVASEIGTEHTKCPISGRVLAYHTFLSGRNILLCLGLHASSLNLGGITPRGDLLV
jgi:hypothetical protein